MQISFVLNGQDVEEEIEPRTLLAGYLRDQLGLTGTKVSCDAQICGACTVLVDGAPVSSCTMLAADVDGRDVTTVEGLDSNGQLHPLQQAFAAKVAFQCGFCTSGMLMAVEGLLRANADPSREELAEALDGNVCRCGTYPAVGDAVRSLVHAGGEQAPGEEPTGGDDD